jgi:Na+/proline symporter
MKRNWRDLIGGIVLVPVLHLGFGLLLVLLRSLVNSSNPLPDIIFFINLVCLGITQFFYLIPAVLIFREKQRFEVVKGISIGAMLTILVNGACFSFFGTGFFFRNFEAIRSIAISLAVTLVLAMLPLYGFNYRRRGTRPNGQSSEREP